MKSHVLFSYPIRQKGEAETIKLHISILMDDFEKAKSIIPSFLINTKMIKSYKHFHYDVMKDKVQIDAIKEKQDDWFLSYQPKGYQYAHKKNWINATSKEKYNKKIAGMNGHIIEDSQYTIYLWKGADVEAVADLIMEMTQALRENNINGSLKPQADTALNEYFSARQDSFESGKYVTQRHVTKENKTIQEKNPFLIELQNSLKIKELAAMEQKTKKRKRED